MKKNLETNLGYDEDTLQLVQKYDKCLNPIECSFGVQAGNFLEFMLTRKGNEAYPNKLQATIAMRSPYNVKEVQQLTKRQAALSSFLSCAGDKAFIFLATLNKKQKFEWKAEFEEASTKIKEFLTSPSILTRSKEDSPFLFYLSVTRRIMCSVFFQEIDKAEKPVYFVRKFCKGTYESYYKIEKLALVVVIAVRKLQPYLLVKTNYMIHQVLKKTNLMRRMVSWSVELSKYNIQYVRRGSIKSQPWSISQLSSVPPLKRSHRRNGRFPQMARLT